MANAEQFIEVPVTNSMWERIVERAGARPDRLNRRTAMAGKRGNRHKWDGVAGELVFDALFTPIFGSRCVDTNNHDFVVGSKRIEVKTRNGSGPPAAKYEIHVPCYSFEQQQCDGYVFAYAQWDGPEFNFIVKVFFVGWATKQVWSSISWEEAHEGAQAKSSKFNLAEGGQNHLFSYMSKLTPMCRFTDFVGGFRQGA